tara:strand:+ start:430 stop:591 length:162 start_codon:yes stop_codon:yes gene_type:complete
MWESSPDGQDGFVTDGSFKGSISKDYKTIHALWRTRGTDETATINPEASGEGS